MRRILKGPSGKTGEEQDELAATSSPYFASTHEATPCVCSARGAKSPGIVESHECGPTKRGVLFSCDGNEDHI